METDANQQLKILLALDPKIIDETCAGLPVYQANGACLLANVAACQILRSRG
jgi:hypothetical protein